MPGSMDRSTSQFGVIGSLLDVYSVGLVRSHHALFLILRRTRVVNITK